MAETSGLFIGWGPVYPGREAEAVKFFGETLEYYGGLKEQGRILDFEPFLLESHGGDLGGFFLIRGEAPKIAELRVDAEFQKYVIRAGLMLSRVGVVGAFFGESLERIMKLYEEQVAAAVA